MPLVEADLPFYLSTKSGSAGNTTAQGDPNLSLGKYLSTTPAPETLNGLFDGVTAARNGAGEVDYRSVWVRNVHATLTATAGSAYLEDGDPAGGMQWAFGVDPTAAAPVGRASAQGLEIANDTTAPAGVTWSTATTPETGQSVGNIPPGYCRQVWIRCTQTNAAAHQEAIKLRIRFSTLA